MSRMHDAVRRAAEVVDVPGTPRALRVDDVTDEAGTVRVRWSFRDPNGFPGDPDPPVRRVRGETTMAVGGDLDATARDCWAEAQLAAARAYKSAIDADFLPGIPYVRRVWTVEEAWQALLDFLAVGGSTVLVGDGRITVTRRSSTTVFIVDPAEWAAYLQDPEEADVPDSPIVRAATPTEHGLPLWVLDELQEAEGAWGPTIALVDGEIVGIGPASH